MSEDISQDSAAKPVRSNTPRLFAAGVLLLAAVAGAWLWYSGRDIETTDDAFIESDVVNIAPRVGGTVLSVAVKDNQMVKTGDLLFEIDPRDFQLRVDQSQAALAAAEARVTVARDDTALVQASTTAVISQAEAGVAAAEASLAQAQAQARASESQTRLADTDVERYKALVARDEIPRQRLDQAITTAESAHAQLEAAHKMVGNGEAQLRQAQGRLAEARTAPRQVAVKQAQVGSLSADIVTARAQLALARQDLAYTRVLAPGDGRVTRKSVLVGQVLQGNQTALAIVSANPWVTANFKETQLTRMAVGQAVTLKVDAFPGRELLGHIDSLQPGTGARFSLLPPENATGNYVKVVQRVPVKIVFDEPPEVLARLAPGMSVEPRVQLAPKSR
ncbi:MAG: HlyD family secretion protein [Pseudomonadota bacterium]|nr:HlyD family secretion protein [Pseudomonadota bacterium]